MSTLGLDALVQLDIRIQEILFQGLGLDYKPLARGRVRSRSIVPLKISKRIHWSEDCQHLSLNSICHSRISPISLCFRLNAERAAAFACSLNQTATLLPLPSLHQSKFSARITTNSKRTSSRRGAPGCGDALTVSRG